MAAYPEGHPYGRPLRPSADRRVTIAALKKFHSDFYRSNNAS
jgi:predicted Zn-dependent peptidase